MKQKLLTLLLFVMALYIVFAGGGEQIDDSASTSSEISETIDGLSVFSSDDLFYADSYVEQDG